MGRILDATRQYFVDQGWHFVPVDDPPALEMEFIGDYGQWRCVAIAREEAEQLVVYSIVTDRATPDRMPTMAELMARANKSLVMGNFELDYDTGEVRFKTALDVEGSELTQALVGQLVQANLVTIDVHLPAIMAVMLGGKSALEALEILEDQTPPIRPGMPIS